MSEMLNQMLDSTVPSLAQGALPLAIVPTAVAFFAIVLLLASKMLGWRQALSMFIPGMVIAYLLEEIGVHTGLIFGAYYFNAPMGPKLDVVPIAHPFLWASIIFFAWVIANLLIDGSPTPKSNKRGRILFGAAVCALVVSTLDITGDPFCVKYGFWTWPTGGDFFGIPYHNWVGWFVVGFCTSLVHGFVLRWEESRGHVLLDLSHAHRGVRIASIFPLVFFVGCALFYVLLNYEGILGLVSVYAMGIPCLLAIWQWARWYSSTGERAA